jgi:H+/Cl- antiporter ClcA
MDGAEILVPILIMLGAFAMIFGIVYLRTRENLAILEKGKDPRSPRPYNSLKAGLLFVGAGVGLVIAYILDSFMERNDIEPLYFALIAIGGGIGLILSFMMEKRAMEKNPERFL